MHGIEQPFFPSSPSQGYCLEAGSERTLVKFAAGVHSTGGAETHADRRNTASCARHQLHA